jgi:DNA-binding transcriptional regulator YhcF (GntR family)
MEKAMAERKVATAYIERGRRPRASGRPRALSVTEIHDRILAAILEHRLLPGTQLVEERLASIFGVSRTKVRQAIARLSHDGIATVYRNRGAFVSSPTVTEAREVFETRRLIEPWLIRRLAAGVTREQIERLRSHVALESNAHAANDRRAIIRLSGEDVRGFLQGLVTQDVAGPLPVVFYVHGGGFSLLWQRTPEGWRTEHRKPRILMLSQSSPKN